MVTNKIKFKLNPEQATNLYYKLYLFRRFEEVVAQFYRAGHIAGFCHLYIGQEALATGIDFFMTPKDSVITGYRDHITALLCGGNIHNVLAELCGKKEGMIGGKGGSMHFFNKEHNFYGGHGIVGATVPLGAGAAFAHKYKKDGGVSVAYIGDGAMLQGQVAEALNMASLWKLPLITVVENNRYAMGTSVKRSHANEDVTSLGVAYNIKTMVVNGQSLVEVLAKFKEAFEYVRTTSNPVFIDAQTYRYRGHSMSDPAKYRTRDEVDDYRTNHDPIINFEQYVLSEGLLDKEQINQINQKVEEELKELDSYISTTEEPREEELYTKIYR